MPIPGSGHDVFESGKFGFPAEFADGLVGCRNQLWGIARTSRFFYGRNAFPRNLFTHLDNLANGISVAISQIKKSRFARREGKDMGLGEVNNVNIIANTGAIRRRIIGPVDFRIVFACPSGTFSTFGIRWFRFDDARQIFGWPLPH